MWGGKGRQWSVPLVTVRDRMDLVAAGSGLSVPTTRCPLARGDSRVMECACDLDSGRTGCSRRDGLSRSACTRRNVPPTLAGP